MTGWYGGRSGRPRDRWHVSDYPQRLDARSIRRELLAEGGDPRKATCIEVTHGAGNNRRTDRARMVAIDCPIYGVRLWLVCPRCGSRRVHLYHVNAGIACRSCLRIIYTDRRRRR